MGPKLKETRPSWPKGRISEASRKGLPTIAFLWVLSFGCSKGSPVEYVDIASLDFSDHGETQEGHSDAFSSDLSPITVTEHFKVLYGYRGRPFTSAQGLYEFRLADSLDNDPKNDVVLLQMGGPSGPTCEGGCFFDKGLRYLAVISGVEGSGYTLKVYEVEAPGTLKALPLPEFKDAYYPKWRDGILYFVQKVPCQVLGGCYDVIRLDPEGANFERLTTVPNPQDITAAEKFQYSGTFTVGEDGKTLLFAIPTNLSLSIYVFKDGSLKRRVGPLCSIKDSYGNCSPAGEAASTFTDTIPMALDPTGKTLVFAYLEDNRDLRLCRHEEGLEEPRCSTLLHVASNYRLNACYNKEDWQFTEVLGPMRFGPGLDEVLFIGASMCKPNQIKPWTNIYRLEVSKIGGGRPLERSDFFMVTNNPQGDTPRAIAISFYDLSPKGEYVVITGTPLLATDGSPIGEKDQRHINGSEVFIARYDGEGLPVQVTNSLEWLAEGAVAVPQKGE